MKVEWTTSELKEAILVVFALAWGVVLLYPGNSFAGSSRVDFLAIYAPDTVWGVLLILVSLPMLRTNKGRFPRYRRFAHAFYWVFWLGIFAIAIFRSTQNGLSPTDFLVSSPFLVIALMHSVIYAGLGRDL